MTAEQLFDRCEVEGCESGATGIVAGPDGEPLAVCEPCRRKLTGRPGLIDPPAVTQPLWLAGAAAMGAGAWLLLAAFVGLVVCPERFAGVCLLGLVAGGATTWFGAHVAAAACEGETWEDVL